ncbi:MAG: amino acid adenylation domain-containing protein [Lachnospiraceae bacterium]|nr:amino acid adenylation domain-containing protein [Lachnospiraceae bacterium]
MERNVVEILEQAAVQYQDKVAVKDSEGQCTFRELCEDSKRIGSALSVYSLEGQTIPVYMEKSILALKSFFGIVYSGGCYSLLNPIHPKERLEKILEVVQAPVVITDKGHVEALKQMKGVGTILLAEELVSSEVCEEKLLDIREKMIDTDALYVNFTSGSTGVPKGVVVGHKSVIEFMNDFVTLFQITDKDIIGNQAPFDFDVSVKDIYSMLLTGATMYIIPKEAFLFPQRVLDILVREEVTTLIWAVSALCMITSLKGFAYKVPSAVNKILFSGEVMPISHLQEWRSVLPQATFVNLYGPTEITCNCTYYVIKPGADVGDKLPIGKAFSNERVFLLDEQDREICEPAIEGEICVAGSTLALGYFRDRDKTDKAFVQNPLNDRYHELIYRTGDVAYYQPDGNMVYVGRKDFQIKHLGHRIELLEIDAHMGSIPQIERVCCLYDEQKKKIVACYQGDIDKATIRTLLAEKVAKYMIPERFVRVEEMPLTSNGKIDRKKLAKEYLGK